MRLFSIAITILVGPTLASADPVALSGLGNGQGWNDGSYFTGYVTLTLDGADYRGLCIDALHDTIGTSWNAVYIALTDPRVAGVMQAYFGITDPAVYQPKLNTDTVGYALLSTIASDVAENNLIQHQVWAQFAPDRYTDTGILESEADFLSVDPTDFGLIVDANYLQGGTLEQAFLVDPQPVDLQDFPVNSPVPDVGTGVTAGSAWMGLALWRRRRRISS